MNIVQAVKPEPVDSLILHPRNPRVGDIDAIVDSLDQHGQYRPIVANKRNSRVLAGNHTLMAARRLGWSEIQVAWVDIDEDEEVRILLADNRTSDLGHYDTSALDSLLRELKESELGLSGTGYDDAEIDNLLQSLEADLDEEVEGAGSPRDPDLVRYTLLIPRKDSDAFRIALIDIIADYPGCRVSVASGEALET